MGRDNVERSASEQIIDKTYEELSKCSDELYEFVLKYNEYIYKARDYGNGDPIRMVEVHTLTMIEMSTGISISELAQRWKRSKGTVSVNVAALEEKGYIYRQKEPGNAKVVHLYPTQKGIALSSLHKVYDNLNIVQTQAYLMKNCTREELDAFYKVVHFYLQLFADKEQERSAARAAKKKADKA